jgi:hypothetical protein
MYPELMVIPMREELVRAGIQGNPHRRGRGRGPGPAGHNPAGRQLHLRLRSGQDAPGVRLALTNSANQPDHKITVFAGQDREATERARSYFEGNPPSSPAIAILRDGKLVYLMQRLHHRAVHRPANRRRTGPRLRRVLRQSHRQLIVQTCLIGPGYWAISGSAVKRMIPSTIAWAIRRRSKGSLCIGGRDSTFRTCSLWIANSSQPWRMRNLWISRGSYGKSGFFRPRLIAISQSVQTLKRNSLSRSLRISRA